MQHNREEKKEDKTDQGREKFVAQQEDLFNCYLDFCDNHPQPKYQRNVEQQSARERWVGSQGRWINLQEPEKQGLNVNRRLWVSP